LVAKDKVKEIFNKINRLPIFFEKEKEPTEKELLKREYNKALLEYKVARQNFETAEASHESIDIAIEHLIICENKLNLIIKKLKYAEAD
jgi:hypothetical protein